MVPFRGDGPPPPPGGRDRDRDKNREKGEQEQEREAAPARGGEESARAAPLDRPGGALVLILATFHGLSLHHRLSLTDQIDAGTWDADFLERERARRGPR